MSVKVIKNRVFDGKKSYEIGTIIDGLSEEEESALVDDGVVEFANKRDKIEKVINNEKENLENVEGIALNSENSATETIDPNSLALNPDEYINTSKVK